MFSQERRIVAFVIALGIILTSISVSSNSVNIPRMSGDTSQLSSEVWSDDFENVTRTLSEWSFGGENYSGPGEYTPNVTLSNGRLYSDGPGMNTITHNSTTTIGTWSFDMFIEESEDYWTWLYFMMTPDWNEYWGEGYVLAIFTVGGLPSYYLQYIFPGGDGGLILDSVPFETANSWCHIDITRQTDHNMYVFLNGLLLLQGTDTHVSSSEYFRMNSDDYAIFDNISVSDTVDLDGIAPHWTEPLINHTINYGEDFSYALFADDYSGLDIWWVDTTELFDISDEGVVTSVAILPSGNYSLEVFVSDTFGNVLNGTFNVEILPLPTSSTTPTGTSTGPDPLNPFTIALFGTVGVAWFVAVLFIFRDYRKRRNAS